MVRKLNIPRLELCATRLAAETAASIRQELKVKCEHSILWTDSMPVVCYITNSTRRFKTYTTNRVTQVQWRHVPTEDNPADYVSRGVTARDLRGDHRWTTRPRFLWRTKDKWPKRRDLPEELTDQQKSASNRSRP